MERMKIIVILVAVLVVIGLLFRQSSGKTIHIDDNANGNSADNLYNNGYVCEYKDRISHINIAGVYIIYSKQNNLKETANTGLSFSNVGIYRVNLDGSNAVCLDNHLCCNFTIAFFISTLIYNNL